MNTYFDCESLGFIHGQWKTDGTYSNELWPPRAVLLTEQEELEYRNSPPPEGKLLGATSDGRPCWVEKPSKTYAQMLTSINSLYSAERLALCQAWLVAAVADGAEETARKSDVEAEIEDLDAQHAADIAELKTRYGVAL